MSMLPPPEQVWQWPCCGCLSHEEPPSPSPSSGVLFPDLISICHDCFHIPRWLRRSLDLWSPRTDLCHLLLQEENKGTEVFMKKWPPWGMTSPSEWNRGGNYRAVEVLKAQITEAGPTSQKCPHFPLKAILNEGLDLKAESVWWALGFSESASYAHCLLMGFFLT